MSKNLIHIGIVFHWNWNVSCLNYNKSILEIVIVFGLIVRFVNISVNYIIVQVRRCIIATTIDIVIITGIIINIVTVSISKNKIGNTCIVIIVIIVFSSRSRKFVILIVLLREILVSSSIVHLLFF